MTRTGTAQLFTIRRALIRINQDLFLVQRKISLQVVFDLYPLSLSDFEILVLALEDRRFFTHHGVDLVSVLREFLKALAFRSHGGASTIDMQFVRTATDYRDLTLRRKCYEMLLAWIIQFRYDKLEIFRSYLN